MRRWGVVLALVAMLSIVGGCTSAAIAPESPASGEATTGLAPGNKPAKTIIVGKGKSVMYLDPGEAYDPAKFPKTSMNGEPSDIPFFKPVKDEGILNRDYPDYDNKTFKFLITSNSKVNAPSYFMFEKDGGTLNKAVAKTGYKFAHFFDSGDIKILPNLYVGYYDFAWVPTPIVIELWSGYESRQQELWRAGNDYVIIGAAYNEGDELFADPTVKSFKDLAGKQVGIMNPDYDIEAAFNEMLKKEGMATETAGGTVKIAYAAPGFVLNDLMAMNNTAAFARSAYAKELESKFGYTSIGNTDSVWGGRTPGTVLVVRRDILAKHPDIVRTVVELNYDGAKEALANDSWKKPAKKVLETYRAKYNGPPVNVRIPEEIDAQANPVYLKGVYDYMVKYGYFKIPYKFEELVDQGFYDQIKK